MKISDAIARLHQVMQESGDLELYSATALDCGQFCVESDRVFEVVSKNGTDFFCAYMPELEDSSLEPVRHLEIVQ